MASQSQGIQQLLQAEKRAAEKVAEARKREWSHCGLAQTQTQVNPTALREAATLPSALSSSFAPLSFVMNCQSLVSTFVAVQS